MFGTYRINERKDTTPRLSLTFSNGELNLYSYSTEELTKVNAIIFKNTKPAFIYFNNTASTAGVLNALEIKKLNQPQ